ncbi:hypothetical protein CAEBREN_20971 [Caenorhabditis brenneri]|uniref:Uncharacterized protein n=1 Tax=Caenorhabditis brenneri TaxID=135651 RepID=G0M7D4_CAEBE|nr:hypothetical protein CAEBREN_20971 [Caenorhabditis brenneri]
MNGITSANFNAASATTMKSHEDMMAAYAKFLQTEDTVKKAEQVFNICKFLFDHEQFINKLLNRTDSEREKMEELRRLKPCEPMHKSQIEFTEVFCEEVRKLAAYMQTSEKKMILDKFNYFLKPRQSILESKEGMVYRTKSYFSGMKKFVEKEKRASQTIGEFLIYNMKNLPAEFQRQQLRGMLEEAKKTTSAVPSLAQSLLPNPTANERFDPVCVSAYVPGVPQALTTCLTAEARQYLNALPKLEVEQCQGNSGLLSHFALVSRGINPFEPVPIPVLHENYWNPNHPLFLKVDTHTPL